MQMEHSIVLDLLVVEQVGRVYQKVDYADADADDDDDDEYQQLLHYVVFDSFDGVVVAAAADDDDVVVAADDGVEYVVNEVNIMNSIHHQILNYLDQDLVVNDYRKDLKMTWQYLFDQQKNEGGLNQAQSVGDDDVVDDASYVFVRIMDYVIQIHH